MRQVLIVDCEVVTLRGARERREMPLMLGGCDLDGDLHLEDDGCRNWRARAPMTTAWLLGGFDVAAPATGDA